jgi:hypothetical protein
MTSSLNKKNYNLQVYSKFLTAPNSIPLSFFVSKFGGKLPQKINGDLSIKSCKVSLIRKIVQNDIFSGSTYLVFSKLYQNFTPLTNSDFVKVFNDVKAFSAAVGAARLQSVLIFNYILDYPLFASLFNPLFGLATGLFVSKDFGSAAPFIFFSVRLILFLKFIFSQNLRIFNFLGFKRSSAASFL